MRKFQEYEDRAFQWFLSNYDPLAELRGGSDSTISDIWSPRLNSYIEVKFLGNGGARCGQFTEGTMNKNSWSHKVMLDPTDRESIEGFVAEHYSSKNVGFFIVGYSVEQFHFLTLEDFIASYHFSVPVPYNKRSGTRSAPKKDWDILLQENPAFYIENDKVYCSDPSLRNSYIFFEHFSYFVNKGLELRKRAKTKNLTYHIQVR